MYASLARIFQAHLALLSAADIFIGAKKACKMPAAFSSSMDNKADSKKLKTISLLHSGGQHHGGH